MNSIIKREQAVMRNILYTLATIALIAGCSSKNEEDFFKVYEKNKEYHLELQKTEKAQLYDSENVTKALLTATYLYTPTEDQNDTRDEEFIVGLYIEDEEKSYSSSDYTLTLNSTAHKNVKMLAQNDPRLKDLSFVSPWSKFYLFTFPHTNAKRFKLLFESSEYGKSELHFAKKAKYVFTKKGF